MIDAKEEAHRYRWVIMAVLWTACIVVFMHRLTVAPLAPFIKEDLNLTNTQVGSIMSAAAFGYMLSILPAGWATDRFGVRRVLAIGAVAAGVLMLGMFLVPSYKAALIVMAISGFGGGCLMPSATKGVMVWFPAKERATVMGFKQTSINVAGIATASVLPGLALTLGWRFGFLCIGILAVAIGIFSFILYKDPPVPQASRIRDNTATVDIVEVAKLQSVRDLVRGRDIWLIALAGLTLAIVEFAVIAHLVLYLTEALFFPVVTAGMILAVTQGGGVLGKPGSGFLSDLFFGNRRRKVLIMWSSIASAVCILIALGGSSSNWMLYLMLFILGVTAIGWGGIYLTLVAELAGVELTGIATSIAGFVVVVGATLGPILFGYIVDTSGSYQWAWLSLGVCAAISVILFFFVREK